MSFAPYDRPVRVAFVGLGRVYDLNVRLRSLATDLVGRRSNWAGAQVHRLVYCTARIDGVSNPSGR
jgi:hypothetical protein